MTAIPTWAIIAWGFAVLTLLYSICVAAIKAHNRLESLLEEVRYANAEQRRLERNERYPNLPPI